MFKQRVCFKNGRYEVELPWKRDSNVLSDNLNLAKRRLGSLVINVQSDKVLHSEYCKVLKDCLAEGIIEEVTNPFISTNNPSVVSSPPSDNKKRISRNETANSV
ncbi:uncharacterized protein LOC102076250 [Trichonephila clavata]|uniref:Uncharacterized protein LOC102076250 n=1 Tax=Trichonephila clavata TaxID=2740835 RepID=A0A8X6FWP6_TRICU|nr:uncharacterized protein LOC102076250 [Trichonephila clavata]